MKKYELVKEQRIDWFGHTLFRVRALMDFKTVFGDKIKVGDLGGFIESENNLSQYGTAWVDGNAKVFGNARVSENAYVSGDALICEDAQVMEEAQVYHNAKVYGSAVVQNNAEITGNAEVFGNAMVLGSSKLSGNSCVCGNAYIYGTRSVMCIGPVGPEDDYWTFFIEKDGTIRVSNGIENYILEDFYSMIEQWDDEYRMQVRALEYIGVLGYLHIPIQTTIPKHKKFFSHHC